MESSRFERNAGLLKENPSLFARELAAWVRPMRKDYRRRWRGSLRRWPIRYQNDLVFQKVHWMGLPAWMPWISDHSNFRVQHPRITRVTGDSLAPETLARVEHIAGKRRGLVIHDGDHSREHVHADLGAYAKFVALSSYFIIEDTVMDLFRRVNCR